MGRREWEPVCLFLLHSRSFRQSVTRSLASASYMWGTSRSATCYHARKQWHERGACAQRCREGGSVPSAWIAASFGDVATGDYRVPTAPSSSLQTLLAARMARLQRAARRGPSALAHYLILR